MEQQTYAPETRQSMPWRSRVRRWMEAIDAFDERIYQRMEASRVVTVVLIGGVWACILLIIVVLWLTQALIHREEGTGVDLVLGALVTIAGCRRYRMQLSAERRKKGQCLSCGYDLRASTDRCPECGRRVANGAAK